MMATRSRRAMAITDMGMREAREARAHGGDGHRRGVRVDQKSTASMISL